MSGTGFLAASVAVSVSFLGGMVWGVLLARPRRKSGAERRKRLKKANSKPGLRSVTRLLFVSTQVSALVWVYISYAIAIYSTVCLAQVYTMEELSAPAINTILGAAALKVLENIFEHNDGMVFGQSKKTASAKDAVSENVSKSDTINDL